jgi:hypothetical protein
VWRGRNRFLGCSKTSEKSKDVTSKIDRCAQHNRETGDCRSKREWEDGFDELIKREDGGVEIDFWVVQRLQRSQRM